VEAACGEGGATAELRVVEGPFGAAMCSPEVDGLPQATEDVGSSDSSDNNGGDGTHKRHPHPRKCHKSHPCQ
jgi:hypothetical protein